MLVRLEMVLGSAHWLSTTKMKSVEVQGSMRAPKPPEDLLEVNPVLFADLPCNVRFHNPRQEVMMKNRLRSGGRRSGQVLVA